MYPTVISDLFGEKVLYDLQDEQAIQEFTDSFVQFDDQFEYGTQIPHILLRWCLNLCVSISICLYIDMSINTHVYI